jgi:hypothetical protein
MTANVSNCRHGHHFPILVSIWKDFRPKKFMICLVTTKVINECNQPDIERLGDPRKPVPSFALSDGRAKKALRQNQSLLKPDPRLVVAIGKTRAGRHRRNPQVTSWNLASTVFGCISFWLATASYVGESASVLEPCQRKMKIFLSGSSRRYSAVRHCSYVLLLVLAAGSSWLCLRAVEVAGLTALGLLVAGVWLGFR